MAEKLQSVAATAQVISVVVGVVISVLSFNATRQKEAEAREIEAAKPFLSLRQDLYQQALKAAAVLANPEVHTELEMPNSKKRFRELYVAELSMVEAHEVEASMMALAQEIDPELLSFNPAQSAAYNLAHALRDTFVGTYNIKE